MRTIHRVATVFSLLSFVVGITGFIGPLVRGNRDRYFNTRPGLQFGFMATNWFHSLTHALAGAVGFLPAVRAHYARSYVGALTGFFGLLAALGWLRTGSRRGVHMVAGMAVNRADNIINTIWASLGLLFTLMPDLSIRRMPSSTDLRDNIVDLRDRFEEKMQKTPVEKIPV